MAASFQTPYFEEKKNYDNSLATRQREYYETVVTHINAGGTITQSVYDSLAFAHQYHFNRFVNYTGTKIVG